MADINVTKEEDEIVQTEEYVSYYGYEEQHTCQEATHEVVVFNLITDFDFRSCKV